MKFITPLYSTVGALLLAGALTLLGQSNAIAYNGKNETEVSTYTSDEALLENKDIEKVFAIKKPSEILEMSIEGIKHQIAIRFDGEQTILVIPAQSADKKDVIRSTFITLANVDKVNDNKVITEIASE